MKDRQPTIKEDIEQKLLELVIRADQMGLVLTIDLQPLTPLAMGNYVMVPRVREANRVYRSQQ
jgi:hypothetical protein